MDFDLKMNNLDILENLLFNIKVLSVMVGGYEGRNRKVKYLNPVNYVILFCNHDQPKEKRRKGEEMHLGFFFFKKLCKR